MAGDTEKSLITRYAIAGTLSLAAYSLLWYATGWLVVLAIFILHASINIERSADQARAFMRFLR